MFRTTPYSTQSDKLQQLSNSGQLFIFKMLLPLGTDLIGSSKYDALSTLDLKKLIAIGENLANLKFSHDNMSLLFLLNALDRLQLFTGDPSFNNKSIPKKMLDLVLRNLKHASREFAHIAPMKRYQDDDIYILQQFTPNLLIGLQIDQNDWNNLKSLSTVFL